MKTREVSPTSQHVIPKSRVRFKQLLHWSYLRRRQGRVKKFSPYQIAHHHVSNRQMATYQIVLRNVSFNALLNRIQGVFEILSIQVFIESGIAGVVLKSYFEVQIVITH